MIDDSDIATHSDPAARERTNHILRIDLAQDDLPGRYEQLWTRTDDNERFELCCIPFFAHGVSLGDVISLVDSTGSYRVESKAGHRTIRVVIEDEAYAHQSHDEFHGQLAKIGVLSEFMGHAESYCAIDIVDQAQADAVIEMLVPLARAETLIWEWADPVVID